MGYDFGYRKIKGQSPFIFVNLINMIRFILKGCIYLLLMGSFLGIMPIEMAQTQLFAQSKKNPSQAAKYAKRGSAKAKKKDFKGALSDYKKAYRLNPTSSYKKRVQQLTSLSKKQSTSKKKPSNKKASQAVAFAKKGNAKAKKKDYAGALKDYQRAYKLNPTSSNRKRVQQLTSLVKKSGNNKSSSSTKRALVPKVAEIPKISPVKYANDIYNIAEAFELSSRKLARATNILDEKEQIRVRKIIAQRAPTISDLEESARKEPNDFRMQVDLARNYEAVGRFEEAKEIYLRLAARNPFNADAHFHLGSFYSRFGQLTKARHAFDEALDVQSNHRPTIEAMATLFGSKESESLSENILAKSAEKDPNGPGEQMQRIKKNLQDENYEYAVKLAQRAQSSFPNHGGFIFLKGKAYEGMGDQDKAKSSYQESIKKDPSHHESYKSLADLYFTQGKYVYSALTYGDAVRIDPSDIDSRFKQGFSYFKASEWGQSASSWEDLLHYDPRNEKVKILLPQAYYILAVEYNRAGEAGLGQTAFRNALSVNKNSNSWLPGAMQTLGDYYRGINLFKESLAAYQEAIELRPLDSITYLGLGITYWKMKESALAKAAWSRSMELDPSNNDARGWLLLAGKTSS